VRRRYSHAANGANTDNRTTDHSNEAATGCCIGQAWIEAEGFGCQRDLRLKLTSPMRRVRDEAKTAAALSSSR
jgi:hypothetical protein